MLRPRVLVMLAGVVVMAAVPAMAVPPLYGTKESFEDYALGFDDPNYLANWPTSGDVRFEVKDNKPFTGGRNIWVVDSRNYRISYDLGPDIRAIDPAKDAVGGTDDSPLVQQFSMWSKNSNQYRKHASFFVELSKGDVEAPIDSDYSGPLLPVLAFGWTRGINGNWITPWFFDGMSWLDLGETDQSSRWNHLYTEIQTDMVYFTNKSFTDFPTNSYPRQYLGDFDTISLRSVANASKERAVDDIWLLGGVLTPVGLVWDGGAGLWADPNWSGGQLPVAGMDMVVDAASGDSHVTVTAAAAPFLPARSVAIAQNNPAKVAVNTGAALSVDNEVTVGGNGTLQVDGTLAGGSLSTDPGSTLSGTGTISAPLVADGIIAPGNSTGVLSFQDEIELDDNAVYRAEIGQWDSENVPDPWDPIPPSGPVNDRLDMIGGDALLGGELELLPLGKLSPSHPLPWNPQVELEWFGYQTRIIASAAGENAVAYQFDTVPEALPEVPNIGTNWGQGHLGEGVFLTRQTNTMGDADPQDLLLDQPGVSYFPNATLVHLFQAADGDTNGDGTLDGLDLQAIVAAQTFGTGAPADWTTGDFTDGVNGDSAGVTDGEDLQAILATDLWGEVQPYAAVDPGDGGDGVVDLILDPGPGSLSLSTDGVTINGYVIKSREGIFTGEPAQNLGAFQIDNDQEISGNFFFTLDGEHFFGNVIGQEWEMLTKGSGVNPFDDLTFTYTRVDMPGTFFGNLIVIPEPGTMVMLATMGVVGLLLAVRRRQMAS